MVVKDLCFYFDEGQLFDHYDPVKEAYRLENFNKTQNNCGSSVRIKFMKAPNEFEELKLPNRIIDSLFGTILTSDELFNCIKLIQKDAWNAAIKWAAENAEITNISTQHITGCITTQYTIDEQSILNGLIND